RGFCSIACLPVAVWCLRRHYHVITLRRLRPSRCPLVRPVELCSTSIPFTPAFHGFGFPGVHRLRIRGANLVAVRDTNARLAIATYTRTLHRWIDRQAR